MTSMRGHYLSTGHICSLLLHHLRHSRPNKPPDILMYTYITTTTTTVDILDLINLTKPPISHVVARRLKVIIQDINHQLYRYLLCSKVMLSKWKARLRILLAPLRWAPHLIHLHGRLSCTLRKVLNIPFPLQLLSST